MIKKGFELFQGDGNYAFSFMLPLILLPTKVDAVTQKRCCKRNAVGALGSSGGKVILTLLAKVIVFQVKLTTIDVR